VGGDLSQIEARVTAWLAGDERILELFRQHEDVYAHTAGDVFHVAPADVTSLQRQAGKVCDLALGFGGAVGALQSMTRTYRMPAFEDEEAQRLVDAWRDARPLYPRLWKALEYAAKMAVANPGKPWRVAIAPDLDYASDGTHLYLRLPSRRLITYRDVKLMDMPVPWGGTAPQLVANGVNSVTRRFERFVLSRVILTENAVQGIAADVMLAGLEQCDRAKFEPVLSVHDELVCEPPPELAEEAAVRMGWLLTAPLPWSKGLPLAVKIWKGERYMKQ
jgi:DNA polymerase